MLAQVLVRNSSSQNSFELREVQIPELKSGQVRIKVSAFGLNYADIMARQGIYRECPPLPCIIGYDVEGYIDEVAPGIESFKKGDRVFALTRFGGYAQYVCTQAEGVSHLSPDAPVGEGCASGYTICYGLSCCDSLSDFNAGRKSFNSCCCRRIRHMHSFNLHCGKVVL